VILNGLRYNEQPQTNVQVYNLLPQAYKAKVIFEDESLGEVDKNMFLEPGMAYTVSIKKKKENSVGKFTRQAANEVKNEFDSDTVKQEYYGDKEDWYVMRLMSQVPIAQAAVPPPPPAPAPRAAAYPPAPAQTTTTTTTTTTGAAVPVSGVSMNVNISGAPTGGGVSVVTTDGYYQESTSTTVTTTTSAPAPAPAQDHYIMAGYNGPYGCPWPMSPEDFSEAKNTISSQSFDDTRLSIAKQVTQSNCLFADQVKEIAMLMQFEDTKLTFAKFAYPYTYDQANYFKVQNAFDFESSKQELNRAIGH